MSASGGTRRVLLVGSLPYRDEAAAMARAYELVGNSAAYRSLGRLELPAGSRLVAGFVHEDPTIESLETRLATIETARRSPVDVATACGLGRRSPQIADELIQRCVHLATID